MKESKTRLTNLYNLLRNNDKYEFTMKYFFAGEKLGYYKINGENLYCDIDGYGYKKVDLKSLTKIQFKKLKKYLKDKGV